MVYSNKLDVMLELRNVLLHNIRTRGYVSHFILLHTYSAWHKANSDFIPVLRTPHI